MVSERKWSTEMETEALSTFERLRRKGLETNQRPTFAEYRSEVLRILNQYGIPEREFGEAANHLFHLGWERYSPPPYKEQ